LRVCTAPDCRACHAARRDRACPAARRRCRVLCRVHGLPRGAQHYLHDGQRRGTEARLLWTGSAIRATADRHLHARWGLSHRLAPGTAGFDRNCPGPEPLKVAAVVSWYGVFDYTTLVDDPKRDYAITWIGGQPNYKDVAKRISPMTYVRAGLPPVMAIHGDADPIVPYEQDVREIDARKKAGRIAV